MTTQSKISALEPVLPIESAKTKTWVNLKGCSRALAIIQAARGYAAPLVVVTPDTPSAHQLQYELRFFSPSASELPIVLFPDWETLPYDNFSPYQDLISERLALLYRLPNMSAGVVITAASTLMHRLPPQTFLDQFSLHVDVADKLDVEGLRHRLVAAGYHAVSQVMEHGEFTIRGGIIDLFPMGSKHPYRIEMFDDEIDSVRRFDPETQRTVETAEQIRLLPGKEFPFNEAAIESFRKNYRRCFEGDPSRSVVYQDVSAGRLPPGIEYYLPLFFDSTAVFTDYLPKDSLLVRLGDTVIAAERFSASVKARFEQRRSNVERPPLEPKELFVSVEQLFQQLKQFPTVEIAHDTAREKPSNVVYDVADLPDLALESKAKNPIHRLEAFIQSFGGRVLIAAETAGRREALIDLFKSHELRPQPVEDWQAFLAADTKLAITVAPMDHGMLLNAPAVAVVAEGLLYEQHVMQRRGRAGKRAVDPQSIIKDLSELNIGDPVVHEDHGVGRYLGLQLLEIGEYEAEFLTLEYRDKSKLFVPVSSLNLIHRYTGSSPETAPLHKLGSDQWDKAKRKAREKIHDVAAELLEIYAKREARTGFAFDNPADAYQAFANDFAFEETPDQARAIAEVVQDLQSSRPMDRLVCGDVGFGKTEVAMRAAFVAAQNGKQVAMLVPTTLLAEQHTESFRSRFADWPIRVETLSRLHTAQETKAIIADIKQGKVDVVIGTHRLIQPDIEYKDLGLVIIDEEHRFGVRQKEMFKKLRAEIDILVLTATPIPRTLSMSMSGLRELSIIATPPKKRLAVKTFLRGWDEALIREACLREFNRGGQVYFLHNAVDTIDKIARELAELVPEAKVAVGHGQLPKHELEAVMNDFYHQRINVLVCSTIIESGIDVPNANTIVINRADRLGLAQLHQLRGRVGRSHHQAYAYLLVPDVKALKKDAAKRLEAFESLGDLGIGFTLATHDMEIRGAGELLGGDQSGQINEIGYTLYNELLERAVASLKSNNSALESTMKMKGVEVDIHAAALIPDDYLPDIHTRLQMYKQISGANDLDELRDVRAAMVDRFGKFGPSVANLFEIAKLNLGVRDLGVKKIDAGDEKIRVSFTDQPNLDVGKLIHLIQAQPSTYQFDGKTKLTIAKSVEDTSQRLELVAEVLSELAAEGSC